MFPHDEHTIKNWHDFIRSLKSMTVAIPFASTLAAHFPTERIRSRRDFPKLLGLIETSAFMHQHQREKREERIIASLADYLVAKSLFENCYAKGPDTKLTELLFAAEELHATGTFRVSDLIEKTGWGKSKAYQVLVRAEELGRIAETETRGVYRFIRNSAVPPLELPDRFNLFRFSSMVVSLSDTLKSFLLLFHKNGIAEKDSRAFPSLLMICTLAPP